jgi:hypothetical protein
LSIFHAEAGNEVNVLVLPSKFSVMIVGDCADTTDIQQEIMPVTNKILNFLMIFFLNIVLLNLILILSFVQ